MAIREHRVLRRERQEVGSWGSPRTPLKWAQPSVTSALEKVHWGLSLGCVAVTTWLPVCEVGTAMVPHPVVDVSIS